MLSKKLSKETDASLLFTFQCLFFSLESKKIESDIMIHGIKECAILISNELQLRKKDNKIQDWNLRFINFVADTYAKEIKDKHYDIDHERVMKYVCGKFTKKHSRH